MTAAALPQMAMLDLAKSMTDFLLGLNKDASAGERAHPLIAALKVTLSAGEELLTAIPERYHELDNVFGFELLTAAAVDAYRGTANLARDTAAIFDRSRDIHQQLKEIMSLARSAGVASAELAAAHDAYGEFVGRAMAARPALIDYAEDLEDLIASIESVNEQGIEPLIPHDEIARRLGTHQ